MKSEVGVKIAKEYFEISLNNTTYFKNYFEYIENILLKNEKPKEIFIDQDNIRSRLFNIVSNERMYDVGVNDEIAQNIANLWNFMDDKDLILDIVDSSMKAFLELSRGFDLFYKNTIMLPETYIEYIKYSIEKIIKQ